MNGKTPAVALAGLFAAALGVSAATASADTLVEQIDACIGAVGAPADHAELCMGIYAQPCMDAPESQTTVGAVSCLRTEFSAWDEILNREYDALSPLLDEEQSAALWAAQRAWIAYRDADCAFPHVLIRGTMAQAWSMDCVMQHTARRAMTLRGLLDFMGN